MKLRSGVRWAMTGAAAATISLLALHARAHVVVMPETALAGRPMTITFLVPEGCAGSATTALRIEIPPNVTLAKPQPKPGWTLEITRERVAGEAAHTHERVSAITWRGGIVPDDQYEEFAVLIRVPNAVAPVYFPATQICEKGKTLWNETPSNQASPDGMEHPAPVLKIEGTKAEPHT